MTRSGQPRPLWINEYNCQLRLTAAQLISGDPSRYVWWNLSDPSAAATAWAALHEHGLPWLDRFPTKTAIVAAFEEFGPLRIGMTPAGALDVADQYTALGRSDEARRTLERTSRTQ